MKMENRLLIIALLFSLLCCFALVAVNLRLAAKNRNLDCIVTNVRRWLQDGAVVYATNPKDEKLLTIEKGDDGMLTFYMGVTVDSTQQYKNNPDLWAGYGDKQGEAIP